MNKLINDIFDHINTEIPELEEMETRLSWEAMKIIQELEAMIPEEFHDELEAKIFEMSCIAEKGGFEVGMKYMVRLLLECLS